ncbi:hypothetical protein [Streptomyces sp. NPDC006739]|uniref:hypothetical protein n=1 Tax=Streptomyces sp. NPDC006739 TaxID=3364763 RepID=UPI0036CB931F
MSSAPARLLAVPAAARPLAVPAAPRLLAGCVAGVLVLAAVAGCGGGGAGRARSAAVSPGVEQRPSQSPGQEAGDAPLSEAQVRAALITDTDLGAPWTPTEGSATWRDTLLKAATTAPDCQRLLDALYADEPLGAPTGTYAVTALDDQDDQAQLRYQVDGHRPADVERSLAWLRTLPRNCSQFTAATTRAGTQTVRVADVGLPSVGDDRQGLRVTLNGEDDNGETTTLTLDIAAVRVGDDAIVLSNGALGTLPEDSTRQALDAGVQRLTQVRQQERAQA